MNGLIEKLKINGAENIAGALNETIKSYHFKSLNG